MSYECLCGYTETYKQRFHKNANTFEEMYRKEAKMEAKECKACGKTFAPKYEWSTMCWSCWFETPAGRKWKEKKDAEENGFDRARAGRERDDGKERDEQAKQDEKFRHRESFRDAFRGGNDSGVVGLDKMMLRKLLQLCHPDKHGGSALAESVTAELLKMKDRL